MPQSLGILFIILTQSEIKVEIKNIEIPWYKTCEYSIGVQSKNVVNCPEWNLSLERMIVEMKGKEQSEGRCVVQWYIDPLRSGNYLIPPAVLRDEDGKEIKTSAFILSVREPTQEEINSLNIESRIFEPHIKNPWYFYLKYVGLIVFLGGIVIGGSYLLYKYLFKIKEVPVKVELPWEKALRRLKELKAKDLPSQGLYEPYYIQLSWILRYYIEDRFYIRAPELTTQEFIETALRDKSFPSNYQGPLINFLRHCDRVKFAKFEPTIEQMEESFKVVWEFVEETASQYATSDINGNKVCSGL